MHMAPSETIILYAVLVSSTENTMMHCEQNLTELAALLVQWAHEDQLIPSFVRAESR